METYYTYKYFCKLGISKSTIYHVIEKMDKSEPLVRKTNRKWPVGRADGLNKGQGPGKVYENILGASQRNAAFKLGVSISYVNRIVSTKTVLS